MNDLIEPPPSMKELDRSVSDRIEAQRQLEKMAKPTPEVPKFSEPHEYKPPPDMSQFPRGPILFDDELTQKIIETQKKIQPDCDPDFVIDPK